MILGAFNFIYDVVRVSVDANDVIKCAVVFISLGWSDLCCIASSFFTNEVNL